MCLIPDFSVICSGQTPTKMCKDGAKMIAESPLLLDRRSCQPLPKSTISTWSVAPTRSSKMATSFSLSGNWWRYSQLLTTAVSSTMPALWCQLMTHWCAASRFWNRLRRNRSSLMEVGQLLEDLLHHRELSIEIIVYSNLIYFFLSWLKGYLGV